MQLTEIHTSQEILALVPEPSKESLELLEKSIKQHGQHEPIVAWKEPVSGKPYIVDGHSRYKVCRKLGIEPKVQYRNFDNWTDAMLYAIQVNGKRRHLCDLQKVELALREIEVEKKLAKERQMKTHPKKGQKGFQNLPNGTHTGDTCTLVSIAIRKSSSGSNIPNRKAYRSVVFYTSYGHARRFQKNIQKRKRPTRKGKNACSPHGESTQPKHTGNSRQSPTVS